MYSDPSSSFPVAYLLCFYFIFLQPTFNRHWRDQEHLELQVTHASESTTDSNSFSQILKALCLSYCFLRSSLFLCKSLSSYQYSCVPNPKNQDLWFSSISNFNSTWISKMKSITHLTTLVFPCELNRNSGYQILEFNNEPSFTIHKKMKKMMNNYREKNL